MIISKETIRIIEPFACMGVATALLSNRYVRGMVAATIGIAGWAFIGTVRDKYHKSKIEKENES